MPFLFTCPHCQAKTQVDDRYSGQAGNCVTCGGPIQLPRFAAGAPQPAGSAAGDKPSDQVIRWMVAGAVGLILFGALLLALFRVGGQTMSQLSSNRERSGSMGNLKKIAEALNAYAADYGTYPPSATVDSTGKKLHSWRVLILPYLGEDELYNKFDLSVSWDDPRNMQVAYQMPVYYLHPNGNSGGSPFLAAYYRIVGPGTLLPNRGPLSPDQITDDPSQTILVIEGSPIVPSGLWTEPIDLDITRMQGRLTANPGIEPGGQLNDGVAFATADERTHFVPNTIEPITMLSLITANGGERLPDDTLD